MILADDAAPEHAPWFAALAQEVCAGLNLCGYPYCNGEVMATTDSWRQPLARWQDTVRRWTATPSPAAVMRVSIFFDLRAIYGDASLCTALRAAAGRVLVFHHARLDLAFLNRLSHRLYGAPLLLPVVERARQQRRGHPLPAAALTLQACRARYGLPVHGAHNALLDALATAELLLAQIAHRDNRQNRT